MSLTEPPPGGFLELLRRLCSTGLALCQNRLELLGVDLQEQKARFVKLFCLAAVAVLFANTAVLVLTATIVVLAGEQARVIVLVALSLIYLGAAVAAFLVLRRELKSAPPPFSGTISEFKKDREWLDPLN